MNKKKLVIFLSGFIVLAIIALLFFTSGEKTYDDQKSFEKYAQDFVAENSQNNDFPVSEEVEYGQPISTAYFLPTLSSDRSNTFLKEEVQGKNDLPKNLNKEEDKGAFLTASDSYKASEYIESVVIYTRTEITKKEDKEVSDKVYTYNLSKDQGVLIPANQILRKGYEDTFVDKASSQLKDTYGEEVKEGYKEILKENAGNFAITKEGYTFYLNPGTVVSKDKGIIVLNIPKKDLKEWAVADAGKRAIDPSKPMVALTYDDGPHSVLTGELLDILEENNAIVTFFELGKNVENVENSSQLLTRAYDMGNEIGVHSYSHPKLTTLSSSKVKEESDSCQKAIIDAIGHEPTVFRPPYGSCNKEVAEIFQLPAVNWTVDTRDWKNRNAKHLSNLVLNNENLDGEIILMHSIHPTSIEASKKIIPGLIDQGYQLVTVSELFQYKYGVPLEDGKFYDIPELNNLAQENKLPKK